MKKNKIAAFIISILISSSITGCYDSNGNQSEESDVITTTTTEATTTTLETTTTAAPSAYDSLSNDEKDMYSMLVNLSYSFTSPSSLRLASWVSGTVKDDKSFWQTDHYTGDKLTYVQIIGQNRIGGNSAGFAYKYKNSNSLKIVGSGYSFLESKLKSPIGNLSDVFIADQESINRINQALSENFNSLGY